VRAAAVQLNSQEDKQRNLETADRLTRAAVADGANFVLLPEKWTALGEPDDYRRAAETLEDGGPAIDWARSTARELGIDLVAGSISEKRAGQDKLGNTSIHFGPDGEIKAVYRKIHMFDVEWWAGSSTASPKPRIRATRSSCRRRATAPASA
jgi:predicted amidohydrolase